MSAIPVIPTETLGNVAPVAAPTKANVQELDKEKEKTDAKDVVARASEESDVDVEGFERHNHEPFDILAPLAHDQNSNHHANLPDDMMQMAFDS